MTDALAHRGPDASGHLLKQEVGLGLGHRRLAIIDVSAAGAQPMTSAGGRFSMVFNGEIYNFPSLRRELMASGATFRGGSDTEVMLAAFERWGIRPSVERFDGMFAFAVWDAREEALWLGRDRMGEKPLYIWHTADRVVFASELKAIRRKQNFVGHIDPQAFADVLARGYIRGNRTVFHEVRKLRPGTIACFSRKADALVAEHAAYWSVASVGQQNQLERRAQETASDADAVTSLDQLLKEVVADEMVSDVPIGAFLSGGIDSSLISAVMQQVATRPIRTFTIAFDDAGFDESVHARAVATHIGSEHTELRLDGRSALELVHQLPAIFDEPFADQSQLPTLLVSRLTREHVTVALSGDGGDELFGGYSQYTGADSIGGLARRVPAALRHATRGALQLIPDAALGRVSSSHGWAPGMRSRMEQLLRDPTDRMVYETLLSRWPDPGFLLRERASADGDGLPPWPEMPTIEESRMAYDLQTYLPDDILVKVDRSSMAYSLETRAPLLHHRIVEFALSQPLSRKIRDGRGKFLLRALLYQYVPQAIVDRPKQGFAVPMAAWLRTDLRDWAEALLFEGALGDWMDIARVRRVWTDHQRGDDHSHRLWPVLMIAQWLQAT